MHWDVQAFIQYWIATRISGLQNSVVSPPYRFDVTAASLLRIATCLPGEEPIDGRTNVINIWDPLSLFITKEKGVLLVEFPSYIIVSQIFFLTVHPQKL